MPDEPRTTLQPMVHVDDMHIAVVFYERLGARVVAGNSDGDFVLLDVGGSQLTLLAHPPNPEQGEGRVELNFLAAAPLEQIEIHLTEAGVTIDTPTTDQGFGKQLVVRSPDGLPVKINQIDRISY